MDESEAQERSAVLPNEVSTAWGNITVVYASGLPEAGSHGYGNSDKEGRER